MSVTGWMIQQHNHHPPAFLMDRNSCLAHAITLICFTFLFPSILSLQFHHPHRHQPHCTTIRLKPSNLLKENVLGRGPPAAGAAFKIALFADLHFGEDAWTDWGPQQDVNSIKVMSTVLDHETPDFVVYLGDVITANNIPIANASMYWDQALSPTRDRGIPWASLFGNHDDAPFEWPIEWFSSSGIPPVQCPATNLSHSDSLLMSALGSLRVKCTGILGQISGHMTIISKTKSVGCYRYDCGKQNGTFVPTDLCSLGEEFCSFRGTQRLELMKNEIKHNSLSFSKKGPRDLWPSVSNYVLQVASSSDPTAVVVIMYFLDSGGGSYPEVISSAQAEWFQRKSQEINPDSRLPEIIFWHIPSKAYKKVAPWFFVHKPCVGSINLEHVAAQEAEFGIMHILVKRPSVKAIFVGHNHGLDWCCPYNRLWLCFARHTGYGGYGNWPRGARIVEITEKPFSIKSWIRMEDGSSHSEVLLSS